MMESIGDVLRTAREERGYSIDQIARDTNIAKRYLKALEEEDFSVFPGETYLIGFLRTYAEHLDLNPDSTVNLYKNLRIQEQPVPMDELLKPRADRGKIVRIVAICVILAGIGAGAYLLIPRLIENRKARVETVEEETGEVYQFTDEVLERRFYEGDAIEVTLDNTTYRMKLAAVEDTLTLETPTKSVKLTIGQEQILDLDGTAGGEIKVFLRDIDLGDKAAVIHFDKYIQSTVTLSNRENITDIPSEGEIVLPVKVEADDAGGIPLGSPLMDSRKIDSFVILEADSPDPFTLDIVFRGYCLLRYLSDGDTREERYFHKGETFKLDVSKDVRLWISNAGSLKAKISGVDVELGNPGEVSIKLIRWLPDETGDLYRLTVVPIY